METKLFEILDRATCIVVMAVKMEPDNLIEKYMLKFCGFYGHPACIELISFGHHQCEYDPTEWGNSRTMKTAHTYIQKHFDELPNYSTIDVEFILGEIPEKQSSAIVSL